MQLKTTKQLQKISPPNSGSAELSPNALLSQNTVNPETDPVRNPDEILPGAH